MLTFTLTISYLTTSDLTWFMDLIFQVPMQDCSLQHGILLPSPVTSTTGLFLLCSVSSFLLELFLHSSSEVYCAPTDLGSSSFNVITFCLFIPFMGFSRQEYWSGLSLLSPLPSFSILGNDSDILIIRAWIYLLGVIIQFIMVNEISKSRRIEKEIREPCAFKVSLCQCPPSLPCDTAVNHCIYP